MKFDEFLKIEKNNLVEIDNKVDYVIAGVQNYGKGVLNKRNVKGVELTMRKYQLIKENQLMWCKVDTKNGAFGVTKKEHVGSLASTNMCLANIETKKVLPDFLQLLFTLDWFYSGITEKSTGTTNRQYLTPPQILVLIKIPDFTIAEQREFIRKYNLFTNGGLSEELSTQKVYLKKLRQAILQEAVQGKLTQQDNDDESADKLLQRIKTEKQKLIAAGKLKKEKELPPITKDEIPFELPKGWVWCKINDLLWDEKNDIRTGPFGSALNKSEHKGFGVAVLGIESISKQGEFTGINKIFVTEEKAKKLKSFYVKGGDLILSRSGTIGELCVLPENIRPSLISTNLLKISLCSEVINSTFFCHIVKGSKHITDSLTELCGGTTRLFLTQSILKKLIFPLPPLVEQHCIVTKVQRLIQMTNQLEQQVTQNQTQAQQLLQAVLKEAFTKKPVMYAENELLTLAAEE